MERMKYTVRIMYTAVMYTVADLQSLTVH